MFRLKRLRGMTIVWPPPYRAEVVRGSGEPYVVGPDGIEIVACERGPRRMTGHEALTIAAALNHAWNGEVR